jgi:truncated hemoglobin YjbI
MHMAPGQLTEQSIRQMVDTFYLRVRQDAELGPIFENRLAGKWDAHMPRMYAFWTKLLLGTGDFQSDVFGKHMSLENLQKEHFARWLTLFRETAVEVLGKTPASVLPISLTVSPVIFSWVTSALLKTSNFSIGPPAVSSPGACHIRPLLFYCCE